MTDGKNMLVNYRWVAGTKASPSEGACGWSWWRPRAASSSRATIGAPRAASPRGAASPTSSPRPSRTSSSCRGLVAGWRMSENNTEESSGVEDSNIHRLEMWSQKRRWRVKRRNWCHMIGLDFLFQETSITAQNKITIQPRDAFENTAFQAGFEIINF